MESDTKTLDTSLTGTIIRKVEIEADPERVFQAFTTRKDLAKWLSEHYEVSPEKDGEWKMGREEDGWVSKGRFLEVRPNEKLVYTWQVNRFEGEPPKEKPNWSNENPSKVTLNLVKSEKGTIITIVHEGFPERGEDYYSHEVGWELQAGEVLKFYLEHSESDFDRWWAGQKDGWDTLWQQKVEKHKSEDAGPENS